MGDPVLDAEQIAEIRARVDAATEGPWFVEGSDSLLVMDRFRGYTICVFGAAVAEYATADAAFVACARSDVPALLDALAAAERRADEAARWRELEWKRAEEFAERAERAEAALIRVAGYTEHHQSCGYVSSPTGECTCGLIAALAAGSAEPPTFVNPNPRIEVDENGGVISWENGAAGSGYGSLTQPDPSKRPRFIAAASSAEPAPARIPTTTTSSSVRAWGLGSWAAACPTCGSTDPAAERERPGIRSMDDPCSDAFHAGGSGTAGDTDG